MNPRSSFYIGSFDKRNDDSVRYAYLWLHQKLKVTDAMTKRYLSAIKRFAYSVNSESSSRLKSSNVLDSMTITSPYCLTVEKRFFIRWRILAKVKSTSFEQTFRDKRWYTVRSSTIITELAWVELFLGTTKNGNKSALIAQLSIQMPF